MLDHYVTEGVASGKETRVAETKNAYANLEADFTILFLEVREVNGAKCLLAQCSFNTRFTYKSSRAAMEKTSRLHSSS